MNVALPDQLIKPSSEGTRKQQPRYHVRLWDDNEHTFVYVIRMLRELFGHSLEKSQDLAKRVDSTGSAVCLTTTKEHAELKRDQILAYGRDALVAGCTGSMCCSIEPDE